MRLTAGGVAALALALTAAPAHASPVKTPATVGVVRSADTVRPAASCAYSTNGSQGFTFDNVFFQGFGYAGHYSGLTAVPSSAQVTSSGVEAQCLLARYGDYNPGPIDGVFGTRSHAAMRQFQVDMNNIFGAGLSTDGSPGPQSWKWLRWWEQ
jgi:hypothetical protein